MAFTREHVPKHARIVGSPCQLMGFFNDSGDPDTCCLPSPWGFRKQPLYGCAIRPPRSVQCDVFFLALTYLRRRMLFVYL